MRIFSLICTLALLTTACSSKKETTTPSREAAPATAEAKPSTPPPAAQVKPSGPVVEIHDRGGLTDADLELVKTMTHSLIAKAVLAKVDPLVDKMFKQLGRDNFSASYPLFVKGAVASFTNIGVKLVVDASFKKMGKKVTEEIVEKIIRPMIADATRKALEGAFKRVMKR